jgi:L-threonylcarbamoyladenylate synthase
MAKSCWSARAAGKGEPMKTVVIPINSLRPEPEVIARAAAVLRAGGLVAFPTETVYGLGANALDAAAVRRIFTAKGRPANNPLIAHVVTAAEARELAEWPEVARRLAERFWPGPLTLVLPRRGVVPDLVTTGGPTVAVRSPAHPVAQALIRGAGVPLAAPSANRSTQLSPTRAEHVLSGLDGRVEMILDGGPTAGGLESTVLDVTSTPPRLLRPGLISPAAIEEVIGPVMRPTPAVPRGDQPLPSPGMLSRHYAPRARLTMVGPDGEQVVRTLSGQGQRVGWLTRRDVGTLPGVDVIVMPDTPEGYAAQLYAALHDLDARGVDEIVVDEQPADEAWLAVRDRLRRASAPRD